MITLDTAAIWKRIQAGEHVPAILDELNTTGTRLYRWLRPLAPYNDGQQLPDATVRGIVADMLGQRLTFIEIAIKYGVCQMTVTRLAKRARAAGMAIRGRGRYAHIMREAASKEVRHDRTSR
jgi:hypothetical protein